MEEIVARHGKINLFAEDGEEVLKKLSYLFVRSGDVTRGASRLKSPDMYRGLGDCERRGAAGAVVNLLFVRWTNDRVRLKFLYAFRMNGRVHLVVLFRRGRAWRRRRV